MIFGTDEGMPDGGKSLDAVGIDAVGSATILDGIGCAVRVLEPTGDWVLSPIEEGVECEPITIGVGVRGEDGDEAAIALLISGLTALVGVAEFLPVAAVAGPGVVGTSGFETVFDPSYSGLWDGAGVADTPVPTPVDGLMPCGDVETALLGDGVSF